MGKYYRCEMSKWCKERYNTKNRRDMCRHVLAHKRDELCKGHICMWSTKALEQIDKDVILRFLIEKRLRKQIAPFDHLNAVKTKCNCINKKGD